MPAVLTGLVLFTPLIMATWFAPALILFGGARPAHRAGRQPQGRRQELARRCW
jgi:hypothetical protein